MDKQRYSDGIGNYSIKGKILTIDTIVKQFYLVRMSPLPILGLDGKPWWDEEMESACFDTAIVMQKALKVKLINAFIVSQSKDDSADLELIPHGIVIKDGKIIDPISNHVHPDIEQFYLIPKKHRKPNQVQRIQSEPIKLTKEELYALFPTFYFDIL